MNFRPLLRFFAAGFCILPILSFKPLLHGQVSVLSYHNDFSSTGQNINEQKLTRTAVTSTKFGKIYSAAVDGQVYAQPLYVPALPITAGTDAGTTHDTVFVATQHDSVYAIDAISGAIIWQVSLLNVAGGETTVPNGDTGTSDINPEIGITSTPVIAPAADAEGKRYIYIVAKSKLIINNVPHYYFRLHALDIASGVERSNSPKLLAETARNSDGSFTYVSGQSVAGSGDGSINGVVTFNALRENQRPGLTLYNGTLYIAFASHGDNGPYHGWVLGIGSTNFLTTASCNLTPNGVNGGIWQSGGIVDVDADGALYFATGNGSFANSDESVEPVPSDFDANGFPLNHNYGDSIVKLVTDGTTASNPNSNGWGLKVVDYFCPNNQRTLNAGDTDLGSGGVLLLPDSTGSAAHPHLLMNSGKEGVLYLVDRDNMGKFRGGITKAGGAAAFVSTGDAVVQASNANTIYGSLDTSAYYNGRFYFAGAYSSDAAKAFTIANGVYNATPASVSPDLFGYLGWTPSISASSATTNGIAWMIDRGTNQVRAYSTDSLATELYTSGQAANNRDLLGTSSKFGVITVADGKAFIGTSGTTPALVCYGAFAASTTPPAQPVNLYAQTLSGGEIDLFWDDVASNETGYEIYVSTDPANFPATATATTGADATSYVVAGLKVDTTYYFKVRAVNDVGASAFSNTSETTSGDAPPVDFTNGFSTSSTKLFTFNGFGTTSAINGAVLRLTDGATYEARSAWLNTAQKVGKFSTQFTFQLTNADADGFTFVMQSSGLTALGPYGGDLGSAGIAKSIAIKFDLYPSLSTTGLYLNGAEPNDSTTATSTSSGAIDVTKAGINFHSADPLRVTLAYDGTTLTETITDTVTQAMFTKSYTVNLPSILGSTAYIGFTGATGGVTSTQDIQSWSFTSALPTVPAAPGNLSAVAASATQVDLTWKDAANNETGFLIERAQGNGTFVPVSSVGANITTYNDTNLVTGATYSYRVVTISSYLSSVPSNIVTITTPVPPTRPSGAASTSIAAYEIDFKWSDNSNNETGFRILRENGGGDYKTIATLPANTTTYKDTTVVPDTQYDYHIEAFNAAGYVDFTGFTAATPSAVSLATSTATAQEGTNAVGTFTVRRTNVLTTALTVHYTIKTGSGQAAYGTRYTLSPAPASGTSGSATIPAGAATVTISVKPASDVAILGSQAVTISLATGTGYSIAGYSTAAITLLDSPFNVWKVQEFGSLVAAQSAKAADSADYDGDGLSNILEYALGDNPVKGGDSNLPKSAVETVDGGKYLTLTFNRPRPAPTDITYVMEYSAGLVVPDWQPAILVTGYPLDNNDGTAMVKYRAPVVIAGTTQGFIRLRVTRP